MMDGRVRAMPQGAATTGAFFVLHNSSEHHAAVLGARSPAARTVELHSHIEEDGMFKMRQIDRIDVPAGTQVRLQPGGLHVMLIDLQAPLSAGDTVSLTLVFEGGYTRDFDLPVREVGGNTHDHHAASESKGHHAHH